MYLISIIPPKWNLFHLCALVLLNIFSHGYQLSPRELSSVVAMLVVSLAFGHNSLPTFPLKQTLSVCQKSAFKGSRYEKHKTLWISVNQRSLCLSKRTTTAEYTCYVNEVSKISDDGQHPWRRFLSILRYN